MEKYNISDLDIIGGYTESNSFIVYTDYAPQKGDIIKSDNNTYIVESTLDVTTDDESAE
jgi:hypothetical protein